MMKSAILGGASHRRPVAIQRTLEKKFGGLIGPHSLIRLIALASFREGGQLRVGSWPLGGAYAPGLLRLETKSLGKVHVASEGLLHSSECEILPRLHSTNCLVIHVSRMAETTAKSQQPAQVKAARNKKKKARTTPLKIHPQTSQGLADPVSPMAVKYSPFRSYQT